MLLASVYGYAQQLKLAKQPSDSHNLSELIIQKGMEAGENQTVIGYCPNDLNLDGGVGGLNQQVEMAAAVYFPAEKMTAFKGNKLTQIDLGILDAKVKNVKVWIKSSLDAQPIVTQSISKAIKGWNEVTLENPYEIDGSAIYVGYTLTAPAGTYPIASSDIALPNSMFLAINGDWADYHTMFTSLSLQCLLTGDKKIENDVTIASFTTAPYVKPNDETTIYAQLFNITPYPISSYEITYQVGAGEKISKTIEQSVEPFTAFDYEQNVATASSTGYQNITLAVTKVNGKEDGFPSDNTASGNAYAYTESYPRRVLVEQFTTQKCTFCPAGLKTLKAALKDQEFSWVAQHSGFETDMFTIPENEEYLVFFGSGGPYAPAAMFDRTFIPIQGADSPVFGLSYKSFDPGVKAVKSYWDWVSTIPAFITVNVDGYYNEATRNLDVTISGQSIASFFEGMNPKITVFVTEDGLQGTQTGETGVISHDHVLRAVLTETFGDNLEWTSDKSQYTYHTSYQITSKQKPENMTIIAFISNDDEEDINNCMVMNTGEKKISALTGIGSLTKENNDIRLTTENGMIKVDGEYDTMKIFTPTGINVNNENLTPGLYVVKLEINKQSVVKKIMVK